MLKTRILNLFGIANGRRLVIGCVFEHLYSVFRNFCISTFVKIQRSHVVTAVISHTTQTFFLPMTFNWYNTVECVMHF